MTIRLTGLLGSLLLTLLAYFIILNPISFGLKSPTAVLTIFMLALLQSVVQLICFIHLWREKGPLWNFYVFVSTISIIFIVIYFSIWIMDRLDRNMMPWMF